MTTSAQMPRYKCHKEVWALKIKWISEVDIETQTVKLYVEEPYDPIEVSYTWICKHQPTKDGYYVVYKGGYASWSPNEAFESGYTLIEE